MATKKKAAKPASKPTKPVKPVAKPAKKAAPAKKVSAPAAKPASKPAPKPVKKAAPAKKAAKPAAKPTAKPEVKKVVAKAPAPAKKVAVKPTTSTQTKSVKPATPVKQPAAPAAPVKKEAPKPAPQPVAPAPPPVVPPKPKADAKPVPIPRPVPKKVEPLKEVKVPKISVKTSVPYNPEYRPLEQRENNLKSNEPLVRYSDVELNEFRELINKKMEAAKKELAYLQGLITRKDEMGGDETENRYMTMEDGSMSMEREQLSQMASRQITYVDHLEKAVIRIENKTYGICRVTGKLIDKARLRAVPHATLSLEAKLGLVKPSAEQ
jgi:RNA polymerase-binding transcription factor DksA